MNWELFQNSVSLAGLVTVLALGLGFCGSLALAALPDSSRRIVSGLLLGTLALPPFMVANAWLRLFGYSGALKPLLNFDIFSFGGTAVVMTIMFAPLSTLLLAQAWRRLDPALLEAEPQLRAGALVKHLLIPLGKGAMMLAAILTFVLAFNHFTIPALLQTKVYPVELWIRFNTTFDYGQALLNGLPLVIAPMIGLLLLRGKHISWGAGATDFAPALFRQRAGALLATTGWTALVTLLLLGMLPLWQLLGARETWIELSAALPANARELLNSAILAAGAATACLGLGLAGANKRSLALSWLFFFVPGALLGVAFIYVFNRPALAFLYQSIGIGLLALTLRFLAVGWTGARVALAQADPALADAARLSGANRWQVFRHAIWPRAAGGLIAVWLIVYLFVLWDVEALSLITPPGGETLSWRAFNLLHYGHTAQVNAICLMVLGLAAAPGLLWILARALRPRAALLIALAALAACGKIPSNQVKVESAIFESVQVIGTRGAGAGQFNKPRALACDRDDNLYVADITGRIQKFSPDGKYLLSWQMPETDIGKPKGMDRDMDGRIIVIEPHYSRVNHFDSEGRLAHQWGVHGTNAGQLFFPRAAAVTREGNIWLSEYGATERVQLFDRTGTNCLLSFGARGSGPAEFDRPEGVGIGREGELLVADSCNHRIQVFSGEGKFLSQFGKSGTGPGELGYPSDVRADFEGRIYVAEFGNSRIQIFDRAGKSIEILGSLGPAPGQFFNPWSLAFDSKGNLYVADAANHRVQKFIRRGNNVAGGPGSGNKSGRRAG